MTFQSIESHIQHALVFDIIDSGFEGIVFQPPELEVTVTCINYCCFVDEAHNPESTWALWVRIFKHRDVNRKWIRSVLKNESFVVPGHQLQDIFQLIDHAVTRKLVNDQQRVLELNL